MVSNSSKEHREQAKDLLKNSLDPLRFCSEDGDTTLVENGEDRPQGRRPALGRKPARFSFKPSTSPFWGNLELKSSLLVDPEEFFLFLEKHEIADKELNKLRGQGVVSTAMTQHYQSITGRQRRPGILRRTARYKHFFPVCADNKEAFLTLQDEVLERGASTLSTIATDTEFNIFLHLNNQPDKLQKMKTNGSQLYGAGQSEGSVPEKTKAESILLDSLLSSLEDLGEDEGAAFLQERLQLKPTNVDKIRLPELNRVQKVGVRGTNVQVMGEKVSGSLFTHTSPTLTRSPLAATSLLQRRVSQRDPQQDPYAFPPADDAPPANSFSSVEGHGKCTLSPPVNIHHPDTRGLSSEDASTPVKKQGRSSNFNDKMKSPTSAGHNTSGSKIVLGGLLTEDSPSSLDSRTDHRPSKFGCAGVFMSSGLDGCAKDKGCDAAVAELQGPGIEGLTSGTPEPNQTEALVGCGSNKSEEKSRVDNVVDVGSFGTGCVLDDEFQVNNSQQDEPTSQHSEGLKGTNLSAETCTDNLNKFAERYNEEVQRDSGLSVIRRVEPKAPQRNKQNSTRRKSLAEAGTNWDAGLRRSTRIKTRPLEYWRGERLLYGRIHESLATVIGIKYSSPFKDGGKPALKVKSYVSEEYAELVEKSALH